MLFCTYLFLPAVFSTRRQIKFLLSHTEVDDEACVCVCVCVCLCLCVLARPGGRKSWGKSSSRLRTNTLQVLSHAFCACPNRSQGGRSIWRLIIVSKSRAAPTTCIFQASSECPNASLFWRALSFSLLVWSLDRSCAERKLDQAPGVRRWSSVQLRSAPPTGKARSQQHFPVLIEPTGY